MQTDVASPGADGDNRCRHCLRKINFTDSGSEEWEQFGVRGLPHVKVYNRGGSLVGTVDGLDIDKVKSYVAQAKSGG